MKRRNAVLSMAVFTALGSTQAGAATLYWNGNGGTWNTKNWSETVGGTLIDYVPNSDVVFTPASGIITLNDVSQVANTITFATGTGSGIAIQGGTVGATLTLTSGNVEIQSGYVGFNSTLTIAGDNGLTLKAGGLTLYSTANTFTGTVTVENGTGANLTILSDGSLGNSSNDLLLNGGQLTMGAANLVLNSERTVSVANNAVIIQANASNTGTIAGTIQDAASGNAGTIKKTGNTSLTLSGNNTFSGQMEVNGGILKINNGNALGNTTGKTVVSSGFTLQLSGGISVSGESLALRGIGISGQTGALVNLDGNNTWGGAISLDTGVTNTISSDAGKLTINGNVSGVNGSRILVLAGASDGEIAGNLASISTLTKNGGGTWVLSGSSKSIASGLTVNAGKLLVSGAMSVGDNSTVAANATLGGASTITLANNTKTLTVNGTLAPGSVDISGNSIIGTMNIGTGNLALAGTADFQVDLASQTADKVTVDSLLTYGGDLNVDIKTSGGAGGTFDLFDWGSLASGSSFAHYNWLLDGVAFGSGQSYSADGKSVSFNAATGEVTIAVPEPSLAAVLGILGGGMLMRRRRGR